MSKGHAKHRAYVKRDKELQRQQKQEAKRQRKRAKGGQSEKEEAAGWLRMLRGREEDPHHDNNRAVTVPLLIGGHRAVLIGRPLGSVLEHLEYLEGAEES